MKAPAPKRLYLLLGDSFLAESKISEIIQERSGSSARAEVRTYHASDWDPAGFAEEARTYPFFAGCKILVLKEGHALREAAVEKLTRLLPEIPDFTTVILQADALRKEDAIYAWAREYGTVMELRGGDADQAAAFARAFLRERGKGIAENALSFLIEKCAADLALIASSLEKLVLHSGAEPVIRPDAVLALAESGGAFDAFDLTNALGRKDLAPALKILHHLADEAGMEAPGIVGMLNWHFARIRRVKEMIARGKTEMEIAKAVRVPVRFLGSLAREARALSFAQLEKTVQALFVLDWKIKSGMIDPVTGLECFLIEFAGEKKGGMLTA